jgi:hypothetical protein
MRDTVARTMPVMPYEEAFSGGMFYETVQL